MNRQIFTYMESEREFEDNFKLIYTFACKNGLDKVKIDFSNPIDKNSKALFISECNNGFKIAQNLISDRLFQYENEISLLKQDLKLHKNIKGNTNQTNEKIFELNYRVILIRKLADSIAWQIINSQNYIARRFYLGVPPPKLSTSNFRSVKEVADSLNNSCPLSFALISDLTTFIHIGDLLFKKLNIFKIIEVKEGKKNDEAMQIIEKLNSDNITINIENLEESFDRNFAKQVFRFNNQIIRGERASNLLTNENGFDPKTNNPIKIVEYSSSTHYYYSTIQSLIEKSKEKNWCFDVIDNGILFIGAYRNDYLLIAETTTMKLINEFTNKKTPIFDFIQNLRIPISEPIFIKPLKDEYKFDIVFGRVRVMIVINFDKLFNAFKDFGVIAKWLSKSETHKYKETISSGLLIIDNKAIGLKYKGFDFVLGDSFISRIISDNMTPTSAINVYLKLLDETIN